MDVYGTIPERKQTMTEREDTIAEGHAAHSVGVNSVIVC